MRSWIMCVVVGSSLVGCAAAPPVVDRRARLLSLAADEAGQITDAQSRLKRQLNLADRQLDDGRTDEGRRALAAAAGTLRDAKPTALPPLIRIAGWVSISELSRQAKDITAADAACDQAVATLRALDPPTDRAMYAVGVAEEVRELHGKPAAAKLLVESAAWVGQVTEVERRRTALTEVAEAIFNCDDYPAGLAVLRTDPEPVWRSDTLAMLAGRTGRQLDWSENVGNANIPGSIVNDGLMSEARQTLGGSHPPRFEQRVDYRSVFGSP